MIRFLRPFGPLVGSATLLSVLVVACTSADSQEGNDLAAGFPEGGLERVVVEGGLSPDTGGEPAVQRPLNPLCGVSLCGGAIPDDPTACRDFDGGGIEYPSVPDGGPAGSGGAAGLDGGLPLPDAATGDAGVVREGGRGDASALPDAASDAGLADGAFAADAALTDATASEAGSIDAGADASSFTTPDASVTVFEPTGFPSPPGSDASTGKSPEEPSPEPVYACHVRRSRSNPSFVEHRCDLAGTAGVGDACTSSRDCQPGLGCVGEENAGQCLPFCCAGVGEGDMDHSVCGEGSFCTERPLRDDADGDPLTVPVCAIADQCKLDEPYPCSEGDNVDCTCPMGKACSVVRSDGTTSCVTPGDGEAGDSCEVGEQACAPGFFCARSMKTCVKICQTEREGECGMGKCQAAANLPKGFGFCAGMTSP